MVMIMGDKKRQSSAKMKALSASVNEVLGTEINFVKPSESDLEELLQILTMWREEMNVNPRELIMNQIRSRAHERIDGLMQNIKGRVDTRIDSVSGKQPTSPSILGSIIDEMLGEGDVKEKEKKKDQPSV